MTTCFEPDGFRAFDPMELVAGCVENGRRSLLLDDGVAPEAFFDLSTGIAGELLHQLGKYGIRLAVVVPDPARYSQQFQALVAEANRGRSHRFFATRAEAVAWLERDP